VSYVPRAARQKSPIRDLRGIINKSQREFARSLGISPSALKRIENNDLALSRRVAYKIALEAGIDRQALLRGRLRTIEGQQYTALFYQAWKENYSWQSEDVAKVIASGLEPLLVAAAAASKKRMWQVLGEIHEALDRCRTRFNLQRPIDAFLAEQRPPRKWDDLMKPLLEWKASKPTAPKSKPLLKRQRR
jgi:transcriptional regulator with XRE-family HTH domain